MTKNRGGIWGLAAGFLLGCLTTTTVFSQASDDPFAPPQKGGSRLPTKKKALPDAFEDGKAGSIAISLTAEWIEVGLGELPGLLRKHGSEADSRPLYDAVTKLMEAEKATRVEIVYGRIPIKDRATIQSIEEMIYPTEYDPPEIPNQVTIEPGGDAGDIPMTAATPAAFETRNVGTRVETEPEIDEQGRIRLTIASEIVSFLGRDYHLPEDAKEHHELAVIWMPRFHTMMINTTVTMESGSTALLGTFKPPHEEKADKRWLLFVHATRIDLQNPEGDEK